MTEPSEVSQPECAVSGLPLPRAVRATYIGLDFVLTLVGNILTIIVTRKVDEFSESTKIFITSLALADLGVTVVAATSFVAEILGRWPFPDWICVASFLFFYTFTAVSITMISILTFDRLIAVVKPLHHSLILNPKRSIGFASITSSIMLTSMFFVTLTLTYYCRHLRVCNTDWS
ncbi:olfactory receptor 1B1-like [Asterias rubens]|uniref:olfactory receptor 1B1-like n=1 Tax=Asterias rubens TaxID=7604 RepID=UPI00145592F5|nr:olfactory receptor 1B1-like [Asterias rubens]